MYVFGGRSDHGGEIFTNNEIYCNKIQVFDTSSSLWTEPVTYGIAPIGRRSHSACKLFFFFWGGGYMKKKSFNLNLANFNLKDIIRRFIFAAFMIFSRIFQRKISAYRLALFGIAGGQRPQLV